MALLSPPKEYPSPPRDQASKTNFKRASIADNFALTTWILLGACLQSTIYMLLSHRLSITSLLPFAMLSYRTLRVYLIQAGLLHNPYMDAIIPGIYTAQIPSTSTETKLSNSEIVVFMVGACNNHPLGLLAPGAAEIGKHFRAMKADLMRNRAKYGMLNATTWLSREQATNNETLWVFYFRSLEGVQRFAEAEVHREGWNWYMGFQKKYGHLAIRHEMYHVPRNRWENVYLNSKRTGLGGAAFKVGGEGEGDGDGNGEERWREADLVDVRGGKLKSIKARMGIGAGVEGEKEE